jgi:hypothetical protein
MKHGWSSFERGELHSHTQFVEVETRRIPKILGDVGWSRVDLLKLDVEVLERGILADGGGWLSRVRLVVFELHPNNSAGEIAALVYRAGWHMERIGYHGNPTYLAKLSAGDRGI